MKKHVYAIICVLTILSFVCRKAFESARIAGGEGKRIGDARGADGRPEKLAVITALGDIALNYHQMGMRYREYARKYGKARADKWPFSGVKKELTGIVVGNLETPITAHPIVPYPDKDEVFYFNSPPGSEHVLKEGGLTVLSVANNHIKDAGVEGMFESARRLEALGIKAPGAGKNLREALQSAIIETDWKGTKVKTAILALNTVFPRSVFATFDRPGTATGSPEMLARAVQILRDQVDIVVVSIHWGDYYGYDFPIMPPWPEQKALAHALIDAGASLIIGHHSHAVGEIERYKNGLIFYSLGEFIFAGRHSQSHATSIIARVTVAPDGVHSYTVIPVNINPLVVWYRPVVLGKASGEKYLNRLTMPRDNKYRNYYELEKK